MEFHPIAEHFPLMNNDEIEALASSVQVEGLHNPILLFEGKILDGRNRYIACLKADIEPEYRQFDGDDPYRFVWSENAERRHLRPDQKVAIKLVMEKDRLAYLREKAKERQGTRTDLSTSLPRDKKVGGNGWTHQIIATEAGVSPRTAARVQSLVNTRPDLLERVASGEISAVEANRQRRRDTIVEAKPLPDGKYRVIYADPPWEYNRDSLDDYGHAGRHYPSMNIAELCNLPVKELAADDAVLFIWVTSPKLNQVWDIIKAWGFEYKTSFVWDKVKHNHGYYNSVRHEFLLICGRGSSVPDNSKLYDSVQSIERKDGHSKKPEEFRAIIEDLYISGRKIELFASEEHPGWDTWGAGIYEN